MFTPLAALVGKILVLGLLAAVAFTYLYLTIKGE